MTTREDPRRLNCQFNLESIGAHVRGYADAICSALLSIDWHRLDRAISEIESARKRRARPSQAPIHVHSLVSNTALLTACANDFGYDVSFERQIEMQAQPGDLLVCISSSGNSANILAALRKASSMGLKTIALTGFGGGESARLADINLHVAAQNYGVVEDCHQILMHNIAQYIYGRGVACK